MKKINRLTALMSAVVFLSSAVLFSCSTPDDTTISEPDTVPKKENQVSNEDTDVDPDEDAEEDTDEDSDVEYDVTFSAQENTYEVSDGTYVITLNAVQAENGEWGNQIFIANPNEEADIAAGDLVIVKITAEADKEIKKLFVKDQFNNKSYSGFDAVKNIPANTPVDIELVGTVADDYNDSASLVLDVRGNEAGTVLKLNKISVAKIEGYDVTSISLLTSSVNPASGEDVTLTVKDQYGIVLSEGVEYSIVENGIESKIDGDKIKTGAVEETFTVKAVYGTLESAPVSITVALVKDYNKYFKAEINSEGNAAPKNYFSFWYDHNWCGSTVTLSNLNATEDGFTLTSEMTGFCWYGTQIWYGVEGSNDVSFKITADASGLVTINGVVYAIEAGKDTDVSFSVGDRIGIQLGYEASDANKEAGYPNTNSVLGNGEPVTVTVKNLTVTPSAN
ncbi:MAG: hypothetical protein MJ185_08870 [Treponema sp.]|nr:hypothetical protein [Treponema sp.]